VPRRGAIRNGSSAPALSRYSAACKCRQFSFSIRGWLISAACPSAADGAVTPVSPTHQASKQDTAGHTCWPKQLHLSATFWPVPAYLNAWSILRRTWRLHPKLYSWCVLHWAGSSVRHAQRHEILLWASIPTRCCSALLVALLPQWDLLLFAKYLLAAAGARQASTKTRAGGWGSSQQEPSHSATSSG